jgi:hypothetical protein
MWKNQSYVLKWNAELSSVIIKIVKWRYIRALPANIYIFILQLHLFLSGKPLVLPVWSVCNAIFHSILIQVRVRVSWYAYVPNASFQPLEGTQPSVRKSLLVNVTIKDTALSNSCFGHIVFICNRLTIISWLLINMAFCTYRNGVICVEDWQHLIGITGWSTKSTMTLALMSFTIFSPKYHTTILSKR